MQYSYSFVANVEAPGFKAKFKGRDGTQWEVAEYWTFLDNRNSDILDNLGHVVIIKQKNHTNRTYCKKFEAYPLEQTEYATIEKILTDSCYWFSITFREYDEAFRPNGKGSFQKVLCKLTFTYIPPSRDEQRESSAVRRGSVSKCYNYTSLKNIASSEIKHITMDTALKCLLQAIEVNDTFMKNEAIDFIVKNFIVLAGTELWQEFCTKHPELKDTILDIVVENMADESECASLVLQEAVSLDCSINDITK